MSIEVLISELPVTAGVYGVAAYVVTGDGGGSPRVTHTVVDWDGHDPVVRLGRTACAALVANPAVTVLWAATEREPMSLIVDGVVADPVPADGGAVRITAVRAVRHRPAAPHSASTG